MRPEKALQNFVTRQLVTVRWYIVSPPLPPEGDKTVSSPHEQRETDGPQNRSGNWKQGKWKMGNGNSQNLMQMNVRVKPLINDHLCTKTTSIQSN